MARNALVVLHERDYIGTEWGQNRATILSEQSYRKELLMRATKTGESKPQDILNFISVRVVATDYDNFAVEYNCQDNGLVTRNGN